MRFDVIWAGLDSSGDPVVVIREWPRPLVIPRSHMLDKIVTTEGLIALALAEAKRRDRASPFPTGRHEKFRALMDRP